VKCLLKFCASLIGCDGPSHISTFNVSCAELNINYATASYIVRINDKADQTRRFELAPVITSRLFYRRRDIMTARQAQFPCTLRRVIVSNIKK
jgi:hypothetical protein